MVKTNVERARAHRRKMKAIREGNWNFRNYYQAVVDIQTRDVFQVDAFSEDFQYYRLFRQHYHESGRTYVKILYVSASQFHKRFIAEV